MFEKIFAKVEAIIDGNFVPKANLDAVTTKLAEMTERGNQLEAQLAQANEGRTSESTLLTAANQQVTALAAERDGLKAENETLKANAKTVDEAAAVKAREICAAQGIEESKIPAASAKATSDANELDQLRSQIAAEKDPKKRSELALKCRALRGHGELFKN